MTYLFHFLKEVVWWAEVFNCALNKFSFMCSTFCVFFKNPFSTTRSWRYIFRKFRVIAVIFQSVIHFKLILCMVWGRSCGLFFFFSPYMYPVVKYPLLKKSFLFHWTTLACLLKINWLYMCESLSGLHVLFHGSVCLSWHQDHTGLIARAWNPVIFHICTSFSVVLVLWVLFFSLQMLE